MGISAMLLYLRMLINLVLEQYLLSILDILFLRKVMSCTTCSKRLFVSRDIVFQEEVHPFKHATDIPLLIFPVLQLTASEDVISSVP